MEKFASRIKNAYRVLNTSKYLDILLKESNLIVVTLELIHCTLPVYRDNMNVIKGWILLN